MGKDTGIDVENLTDDNVTRLAFKVSNLISKNIESQMFTALDIHSQKLMDLAKETITKEVHSIREDFASSFNDINKILVNHENRIADIERAYPIIKLQSFLRKYRWYIIISLWLIYYFVSDILKSKIK